MTADEDVLGQIVHQVRERSGRSRSSLSSYLTRNYRELSQAFDGVTISFRSFSEALAAAGITDANGAPATEAGLRKAWYRAKLKAAADHSVKVQAAAPQTTIIPPCPAWDSGEREGSAPVSDPVTVARTDTNSLLASLSGPSVPAATPIRHSRLREDRS